MDNVGLFLLMTKAQLAYVVPRINGASNQHIYLDANEAIIDLNLTWSNFEHLKEELSYKMFTLSNEKPRFDWFGNRKKHTDLAIKHTLQILISIETRFITGGSNDYVR